MLAALRVFVLGKRMNTIVGAASDGQKIWSNPYAISAVAAYARGEG